MWQTKPDRGAININVSLEQLVLKSLQIKEGDQAKTIEDEPAKLRKPETTAEAEEPAKPAE